MTVKAAFENVDAKTASGLQGKGYTYVVRLTI